MKKLYIFSNAKDLENLKEYLQKFEEGSKIVILYKSLKEIIDKNSKKGEIIRSIIKNKENFNFEIFTYDSFYEEGNCLSLIISSIKKKFQNYEYLLVSTIPDEILTAVYLGIKVFSKTEIETMPENLLTNKFTKNVVIDTSYLVNMTSFELFEDSNICKHIGFFVLQELVNIEGISQLFKLIPFINEKEKYNIKIIKDYTIPYSHNIITNPDLYHILYILQSEETNNFSILTCDSQLLAECLLRKIKTEQPIEIVYNKELSKNIVNKDINENTLNNPTVEVSLINNIYYILYDNKIDKVFKSLIVQTGKIPKRIKGIKYLPVHLNDYVRFVDGKIYQLISLVDKNNLKLINI